MTDRKAVVKNADMSDDMQQEAVDVATQVPYSADWAAVIFF
jgi:hypothetical protein